MSLISHHKQIHFLLLILLIAGICKAAMFFYVQSVNPARMFSPDSQSYIQTAKALLKNGRYNVSPDKPGIPQIIRTPGYPLFIAGVFFLFGENYRWLITFQILISLGTTILTYLLARALWNPEIAVAAVLLLSLDIPSFANSQKVLTETLFTFFITSAIFTGICVLKNDKLTIFQTFIHGTLLSLATLVRPISYYIIFPVIICFIILWKSCCKWRWEKIILALIAFIIPWLILVGGWQLRNFMTTGSADFSCIQGINLLFYRGAGIIAERDGISFEEARHFLGYGHYVELHPETQDWTIAQLNRRWKREGLSLIYQYPGLFLKTQIKGMLKMMLIPGMLDLLLDLEFFRGQSGPLGDLFRLSSTAYLQKWIIERTERFALFLLAESYLGIFYLGAIFSLGHFIRIKKFFSTTHIFIWLCIIYFIFISAGPEAYFRFRIPVMPLLSVYAGHGIVQIILRFTRNQTSSCLKKSNPIHGE